MENRWQSESTQPLDDDLVQLHHLAHLLSDASELLFAGVGSVSLKTEKQDPFGDTQNVLYYGKGKWVSAELTPYNLTDLKRFPALKDSSQLAIALEMACLNVEKDLPDIIAVFHALLPGKVAAFACPTAMMALDLQAHGLDKIKEIYGKNILYLANTSDLALAKTLSETSFAEETQSVFIHQRGFFIFGADPKTVYDRIVTLVSLAETSLDTPAVTPCSEPNQSALADPKRESIADLRKRLSVASGTPLLMRTLTNETLLDAAKNTGLLQRLTAGPLSTHQADLFGNGFLDNHTLPDSLPANNALLDPELGLVVTGKTAADLALNVELICKVLQSALLANGSGGMGSESPEPGAAPTPISRREHAKDTMFLGEIALVTGAASGIGRGCTLSLLDRGAVVIGLDISPEIELLSDSPAYLGLVCDLTDEAAVQVAFETAVRTFGGLDMVVLNAGIFTKSAMIKELDLSTWQRVMRINLDANVTILRESYPLLKQAPDNGRVLVNASRNVPAPGPGAAAYSTSKAGLTQLARVAALEWGKDGIRVNMIHPHAVFDTGIWTDEVLQSRADKYGISVKEYKTRNVLKVELTSHDIGELVCEMLGPVFSKTTGAQVSVDGGSERVI